MGRVTALQRDEAEASDSATSSIRLGGLAKHASVGMRRAVAENPAAADTVLSDLLDDPSDLVRLCAAGSAQSRLELHDRMIDSPDDWVRTLLLTALIDDPFAVSYDHQLRLACDSFREARQRLAGLTPYSRIFDTLLTDDRAEVRGACAGNSRITLAQMEYLITDRAWTTRAIAAEIGLRYPTDEPLVRLATDRSASVRWSVLIRVDAPREALELLTEDVDGSIRQHADIVLFGEGVNHADVFTAVRHMRAVAAYEPFV